MSRARRSHVVEPVDREREGNGPGRVEDQVEERAVVLVRCDAVLEVGLESRNDVTVVELAVQSQKDFVCISSRSLAHVNAHGKKRTCRG